MRTVSNTTGGDVFTLVQIMEKIDFYSSIQWLSNFFNVDITNLELADRKNSARKELDRFVQAIINRRKRKFEEYSIKEEVHKVKSYRGYSESTLSFFDVGYVEEIELEKKDGTGKYTVRNRIVFPIIFKGIKIGASLRRTKSNDYPKWSHQPSNIETGEILYNYDKTGGVSSVVVVEGIPDVLAFHEIGVTAVATFGAHMTDQQYKLLLKTGADIVLAYDGDKAGRAQTKKAFDKLKGKANISIVEFKEGQDPDNLKREELLRLYETRKKY